MSQAGHPEESLPCYQNGIGAITRLSQTVHDEPNIQRALAATRVSLGNAYNDLGRLDGARESWLDAHGTFERLARMFPRSETTLRDIWVVSYCLGKQSVKRNDLQDGLKYLQGAHEVHIRRVSSGYTSIDNFREEVSTLRLLGDLLIELGRSGEAAVHFQEAVELQKNVIDRTRPSSRELRVLVDLYRKSAQVQSTVSDFGEAFRQIHAGIEYIETLQLRGLGVEEADAAIRDLRVEAGRLEKRTNDK